MTAKPRAPRKTAAAKKHATTRPAKQVEPEILDAEIVDDDAPGTAVELHPSARSAGLAPRAVGDTIYLQMLRAVTGYGAVGDNIQIVESLQSEALVAGGYAVVVSSPTTPVIAPAPTSLKWQPYTHYPAGWLVVNPSGQIVSANSDFVSAGSYSAGNWTVVNDTGAGGGSVTKAAVVGTGVLVTDLGGPADLTDRSSTVSETVPAGRTTNATTAGVTLTAPAPAGTVGTPPQRFAIRNGSVGTITVSYPDTTGTTQALTVLAGEVLTFRQKTTSGYAAESGNKPLAQLDLRYNRATRLRAQLERGVPGTDVTYVTAPESLALGSAAGTSWCRHTVHVAGQGFWIIVPNKRANQGTTSPNYSDADPANSLPVKVSWKIRTSPSGANALATGMVRFGGVVTATIDPSGDIKSDFVPVPVEVGTVLEFRVYTTATSWAPNMQAAHSGQPAGFVTGDQTATAGDLASSFGSLIQPAMVLVKPAANATIPVVAFGAFSMSIDAGSFDDQSFTANGFNAKQSAIPALGGGGHLARAAKAALLPFVNFSLGGDQVANFVQIAKRYARSTLLPYPTDMVIPNPTNDIMGFSNTLATVQANEITAVNTLGAAGFGFRLWAGTITPRTTSTDNWQTLANQTTLGATEAVRVAYNTWLRDGMPMHASGATWVADVAGASGATIARCDVYGATGQLATGASGPTHPVAGVFDTAATVESSLNSGKWAAGTALTGISVTAASGTVTAATNQFTSSMVGGALVIPGAGAAGATLAAIVIGYTSPTQVALAINASTTVSSVAATANVLTSEGVHPDSLAHALMAAAVPVAAIAVPT